MTEMPEVHQAEGVTQFLRCGRAKTFFIPVAKDNWEFGCGRFSGMVTKEAVKISEEISPWVKIGPIEL